MKLYDFFPITIVSSSPIFIF